MLIVFGGLPGVGKTSLSRLVAGHLALTWLRIDAIEAALWRAGMPAGPVTGLGAYVVANAIADGQMSLGGGVVVDAVNPVEAARQGWRDLAARHRVPLRVIEVVCSVREEHRRRVEHRLPQPGQPAVPDWNDVLQEEFEPWAEPRLTVDTIVDIEDCVVDILSYCAASRLPV